MSKFNVNRRLLMDYHNYNLCQILGNEYNHDKLFKFVRNIRYCNIKINSNDFVDGLTNSMAK